MVKKDYYPYVYQDPAEVEFFEKVFRKVGIGNEAKDQFERSRKGTLIDIELSKPYTFSNFQGYLMDKYGLVYSKAYAIYWYFVLTRIWRVKPEDAIHEVASKMR